MTDSNLRATVPGKLMIAGEYAVLDPDHKAIVAAVNRAITITVSSSSEYVVSLPHLGLNKVSWTFEEDGICFHTHDGRLNFIKQAFAVVYEYLGDSIRLVTPFHLTIESELDNREGKKYGLGSSAAIVVGVVATLMHLGAGDRPSKEILFKLAAIAHFRAQGNGSGADIAASTYGGWLSYSSFHPEWLRQRLTTDDSIYRLLDEPWPHFSVTPLAFPSELSLCVGWTQTPVSTGPLVNKIQQFKRCQTETYEDFLDTSMRSVELFLEGCRAEESGLIQQAMKLNRKALQQLGQSARVQIETPGLTILADLAEKLGGVGKPSGAGGGDCGIALVKKRQVNELGSNWLRNGIHPMDLHIVKSGVEIERTN